MERVRPVVGTNGRRLGRGGFVPQRDQARRNANPGLKLATQGSNRHAQIGEQVVVRARSSGGERYIDTVEVIGSKPIVPTITSMPSRVRLLSGSHSIR